MRVGTSVWWKIRRNPIRLFWISYVRSKAIRDTKTTHTTQQVDEINVNSTDKINERKTESISFFQIDSVLNEPHDCGLSSLFSLIIEDRQKRKIPDYRKLELDLVYTYTYRRSISKLMCLISLIGGQNFQAVWPRLSLSLASIRRYVCVCRSYGPVIDDTASTNIR